jgi:hypothetical protein
MDWSTDWQTAAFEASPVDRILRYSSDDDSRLVPLSSLDLSSAAMVSRRREASTSTGATGGVVRAQVREVRLRQG